MDTPTVALISQSSAVSRSDLEQYAAAYALYVDQLLAPAWHVHADFVVPAVGEKSPLGAWPFYWQDGLDQPGAAGYHSDENGQPFARIDAAFEPLKTGSHELAETLKDPFGRQLYVAPSVDPADNGRLVRYLLELCDPPEAFSVNVGGFDLSDFILHPFGNGLKGPFSASGRLSRAREVARGGYLSWLDGGVWKQLTNFDDGGPSVQVLGGMDGRKHESPREFVNRRRAELNPGRAT